MTIPHKTSNFKINCFQIGKYSIPLLIILYSGIPLFSQTHSNNYNFRNFESKAYYFGLTFGYNESNFQLNHSKSFISNDSFNIVEGYSGSGLNVSLVTNMKLGELFDFRLLPGFSFVERKLNYKFNNQSEQIRNIESVLVQVPFQLRFKSRPFNNVTAFVLIGTKYTYDLASNSRIQNEQAKRIVRISPHDYSIEIGTGFQIYTPYFILSPELKYSQGIGNILIYNNNLFSSKVIEKIISKAFTISINLEG